MIISDQGLQRARGYLSRSAADIDLLPTVVDPPAPAKSALGELMERLLALRAFTPEFARLLERDAREIEICSAAGAHKAALILCGSLLEGVLVAVLLQNRDLANEHFKRIERRQNKKFPADASLPDLLILVRKSGLREGLGPLLGEVHLDLGKLVTGHRNLVHPNAEVREDQLPINEHTVRALFGSLCALLDGLARTLEGGWLQKYTGS